VPWPLNFTLLAVGKLRGECNRYIRIVEHANVYLAFVAARHVIGKYPSRWW